jgi:uncharacterized protein YndB with AHSA1/START domain
MFVREESIHIAAPPEVVYDYVSDIGRHPQWAAQKLEMRKLADGRFESVATMGLLKAKAVIHVEAAERPGRFVYVADDNISGPHRWSLAIKPQGDGSQLTLRMERMHEAVWARVMQPIAMWPLIGHPGVLRGLAQIKMQIETAVPAKAASLAP